MNCRNCNGLLTHTFLNLGFAPPSNAYLTACDLNKSETYFPLKVMVCEHCWLVQTEDHAQADELFTSNYAYFSSTSTSWLKHAAVYAQNIIHKLGLTSKSFVIEVASNDGYLLKNFVAAGIPCLGIEPTDGTAAAAEKLSVPVLREFFGEQLGNRLAKSGKQADLIAANNVYAHVPDINDFTRGLKSALKPNGTITIEFPHVMRLIQQVQFDTIYHEHFSYLSLATVCQIFEKAELRVWDVEQLESHGGSLRVYGCHAADNRSTSARVEALIAEETSNGLRKIGTYQDFQSRADNIKNDLLLFLIEQKKLGKKVVAYGAAAKGNTILNYAGIRPDLLEFVCDGAAAKQGKFMPGSHIPILAPQALDGCAFDYLLILPWNLAEEIKIQNQSLAERGVSFVTAVPYLCVAGPTG
jgi:hypothetical protein